MRIFVLIFAFLLFSESSYSEDDRSLKPSMLLIYADDGWKELLKPDVVAWIARTGVPSALMTSGLEPAPKGTVVLQLSKARAKSALTAFPFAWKGFVIAVNRKNPCKNISRKDAQQILNNTFSIWPETKTSVRNIYYLRGLLETGKEPPRNKRTHFSSVPFADVGEKMLELDSKAILLLPLSGAIACPSSLRLLSVDGIAPDFDSIVKGRYPLQEQYLLQEFKETPESLKPLVKKLLSPEFKEMILKFGAIPVSGEKEK